MHSLLRVSQVSPPPSPLNAADVPSDSRIIRDLYEPGMWSLMVLLGLYLVRAVVGIMATPCTLYAGYFWGKGDSPDTRPSATASQAESTTRDKEARFRFFPTYQDFELPATAPITAHLVSPLPCQYMYVR